MAVPLLGIYKETHMGKEGMGNGGGELWLHWGGKDGALGRKEKG